MNDVPTADPFRATDWFKSSYSAADNECVEVSCVSAWVGIRDSKALARNLLIVSADSFAHFISSLSVARSGPESLGTAGRADWH
ncbi:MULTISPECIES: DUF397 domain-containing protein [Streptomyces]|uniref:DUF397 domain-containing protein n=1 Tax=Streptomyces TaxID=1883 RepID=UPI00287FAB32|nr:DUF397 domain-containing protein [Streptomyces sp. CGMCC 4.1456]WNF62971.1 DUF397 domain-containing protein [Streptomyces sp. CGMCC 4.1456]